jgi:hypothetical protein
MRIQLAALVVLVATFLSTMFGQAAWSQESDPFGADPFAAGRQKAKQQQTQSPPATPANAAKPSAIGRAARMKSNRLHPVKVAVVNEYESEKRIAAALGDETTNAFVETPLDEAIQMISRNHNIPIVVDRRALEEIGLTPDTPVNIDLKNITLRSFLRLMLRELDLTYMVKDQVMQITTLEAAEQNLGTQMYRLPDNLVDKSGEVLTALQSAIVPDTWSTHGGPSSAATIDHVLIISTTSDVHDQVEDFLNTLIETYGE